MHPNLSTTPTYLKAKSMLTAAGLAVISEDTERPWGGTVIDQTAKLYSYKTKNQPTNAQYTRNIT